MCWEGTGRADALGVRLPLPSPRDSFAVFLHWRFAACCLRLSEGVEFSMRTSSKSPKAGSDKGDLTQGHLEVTFESAFFLFCGSPFSDPPLSRESDVRLHF